MLSCTITDRVSIGQPCCAVHNCANLLPSTQLCYCNVHADFEAVCSVEGC
ncbi:hypothetical protein DACRYDRAFT_51854 [Dacryopinax primogenitus]|uniref:CxC6 like cysteine cluster associated with KDZ domain-containing protein n=1 Tax=Dacryopinax primogenitus (strain DJM 731) TaxID=1858805 RepID=M5FWD9_DACPD|nr:uncharacterized protein DACRYDRAFT_51854 [Dacryopinax primogenitus]EJU02231.1 hypothetical protein DACRYDRAFT_51854 [Dacryopinax primogenitus]